MCKAFSISARREYNQNLLSFIKIFNEYTFGNLSFVFSHLKQPDVTIL